MYKNIKSKMKDENLNNNIKCFGYDISPDAIKIANENKIKWKTGK